MSKRPVRDSGRRDEAVSPVIGVMLMLSVTIIIAATLSAYVGGSTGELKTSPQVNLLVKSDGEGSEFNILFEHHGGDTLRTEDLGINTWVKDSSGQVIKHDLDADPVTLTVDGKSVRVPYLYEKTASDISFGSATWKTGRVAGTGTREATAQVLGISDEELEGLVANNSLAEIDIVYRPSGTVLYTSEIILGE
jgi:FlaG/FlaF family flagellin (archaellin)